MHSSVEGWTLLLVNAVQLLMSLIVAGVLAGTVCLRQAKAVLTMHNLAGSTASNAYPNRGDEAANPLRSGIVLRKTSHFPG